VVVNENGKARDICHDFFNIFAKKLGFLNIKVLLHSLCKK
jgi:hypothetical protein